MKSCPICNSSIPDNYRFCDGHIAPVAYQISQRYPGLDEKDVWQMAITQLEYERIGGKR